MDSEKVRIVYCYLALRYTRIFHRWFDSVPLGGTKTHPEPHPQNITAAIHMGLVGMGAIGGSVSCHLCAVRQWQISMPTMRWYFRRYHCYCLPVLSMVGREAINPLLSSEIGPADPGFGPPTDEHFQ